MLNPMNRHLLVNLIKEEKKESGVLVPQDYMVEASSFSLVVLLSAHADSTLQPGTKLAVPTHMIEEVELFGEKYHVVLENHVIGFFDN